MIFRGRPGGLLPVLLLLAVAAGGAACVPDVLKPTDARIFQYHYRENLKSIELFITRLYAKNPHYQPDPVRRRKRLDQLFHGNPILDRYGAMPSNKVLQAAFSAAPEEKDRVYLLGLGMVKSLMEVYGGRRGGPMVSGLQVSLERLKRLHLNFSQVNWRLKTYRDDRGRLLFISNEAAGPDGYINMGYEVLMTEILTRIADDIYLRGGLPGKYLFDMSTLFVSIVL